MWNSSFDLNAFRNWSISVQTWNVPQTDTKSFHAVTMPTFVLHDVYPMYAWRSFHVWTLLQFLRLEFTLGTLLVARSGKPNWTSVTVVENNLLCMFSVFIKYLNAVRKLPIKMRMPTGYEKIVNYHGVLSLSVGFTIRPDGVQNLRWKILKDGVHYYSWFPTGQDGKRMIIIVSYCMVFVLETCLIFNLRWNYYVD